MKLKQGDKIDQLELPSTDGEAFNFKSITLKRR